MMISVTIAGIDRTAYVIHEAPVTRSWQLGSICTCTFAINSALAGSYRPDEWDTVVIMLDTYKFFSGVVDNYEESWFPGGAMYQVSVNCVGWAALLEKRFIGVDIMDLSGVTISPIPPVEIDRVPGDIAAYWYAQSAFVPYPPPSPPETLAQLLDFIESFLTAAGLTFNLNGIDGNLTEQAFNWLSIAQILQALESQFGILFFVDMEEVIQVIDIDNGTGAAPVEINDANGSGTVSGSIPVWQQLKIKRGGLYRNRQGERTSQQMQASFQTAETGRLPQPFPVRAGTNSNPAQLTLDAQIWGSGGPTLMFTGDILTFSTQVGAGWSPLAGNSYSITVIGYNGPNLIITIPVDSTGFGPIDPIYFIAQYDPGTAGVTDHSSRLSYVSWADDAAEQARIGFVVEAINDVKDVQDKSLLDTMAYSDLAQGSQTLVKVTIDATLNGFEPGQLITIDTTVPPLSTTLLIEQVDSQSQGALADGTLLMRHVIQASNSRFRRGAGLAHQQRLIQAANVPAIPLTGWGFRFTQAETIEGLTNPGLTAGIKPETNIAVRKGVATWCDWHCDVAPAGDVTLDILVGGVSIFATGRNPVIRAGFTYMINTDYAFVQTPLKVPAGAIFQQHPIDSDASFRDGVFTMMFAG